MLDLAMGFSLLTVVFVAVAANMKKHERDRIRSLARAHWDRQQQDAHPWDRQEPWTGMEESHRLRWSRRLKLVVKDTWAKEQTKAVFKLRRK